MSRERRLLVGCGKCSHSATAHTPTLGCSECDCTAWPAPVPKEVP